MKRMTVVAAVLALQFGLRAEGVPDLSGTWIRDSGARGMKVVIQQTANELRIEGIHGLFEGTPPAEVYKLDGSWGVNIQDFGDWWRKSATQLHWDGMTLSLRFRAQADWWDRRRPEFETLEHPHGDVTRLVTFDASRTFMTVETTLIEGNGPPPNGLGMLKAMETFRLDPSTRH